VVDLSNGQILWSYTHADNPDNMDYSLPGTPAIVDTDNDSFVDTAYIGDLGGNMWRFKFCLASDMPNCAISGQTTNWSGGLFFDASSGQIRPIYTSPAAAKDSLGYLWVYWGTGDKTDPTAPNAQEHFYGVRDLDRNTTYTTSNIQNITADNTTYTYDPNKAGWRIQFTGQGEKMLADPAIFGGKVYFTTYTPVHGNDPCEQAGDANLFVVDYITGTGGLPDAARSMYLGAGIPSAPVLSLKPGSSGIPDLYVTTSGGGGSSASTQRVNFSPPGAVNRTNMLYWKDMRVQ
jgi:type IV pilus assembly protein PilY1